MKDQKNRTLETPTEQNLSESPSQLFHVRPLLADLGARPSVTAASPAASILCCSVFTPISPANIDAGSLTELKHDYGWSVARSAQPHQQQSDRRVFVSEEENTPSGPKDADSSIST